MKKEEEGKKETFNEFAVSRKEFGIGEEVETGVRNVEAYRSDGWDRTVGE